MLGLAILFLVFLVLTIISFAVRAAKGKPVA